MKLTALRSRGSGLWVLSLIIIHKVLQFWELEIFSFFRFIGPHSYYNMQKILSFITDNDNWFMVDFKYDDTGSDIYVRIRNANGIAIDRIHDVPESQWSECRLTSLTFTGLFHTG